MQNGSEPGHDGRHASSVPPTAEHTAVAEPPAVPEARSPAQATDSSERVTPLPVMHSSVRVTDATPAVVAAEPASVHVIVTHERTRIVVSGEIDADLTSELQEAAGAAEVTGLPIDVDTQHVTFMDSSGIAFLARLASRSVERVRVLHAPDTLRFLLEITKVGELLELVDGEDASTAQADPGPDLPRIGRPTNPTPDDAA